MFAADRLSEKRRFSDIPASQDGVYLFYNPPLESATKKKLCELGQTFEDIDGIFCVFLLLSAS